MLIASHPHDLDRVCPQSYRISEKLRQRFDQHPAVARARASRSVPAFLSGLILMELNGLDLPPQASPLPTHDRRASPWVLSIRAAQTLKRIAEECGTTTDLLLELILQSYLEKGDQP